MPAGRVVAVRGEPTPQAARSVGEAGTRSRRKGWCVMDLLRKSLVGVTVAGLAVDAYVHLHLAHDYDVALTTS